MIAEQLLGLGAKPEDLTLLQVSFRGIIVFISALTMLRMSAKRFLGRKTAFDFILMFMMSSMLSRAINGSAPLLPTIASGFVLVWLHRLIAALAFHFHWFGTLVKGHDDIIISDGKLHDETLRKHYLSERDIREDLRLRSVSDPAEVREARLERSGEVSVIRKEK